LEINDTNNPSTIYGEEEERKRREKEIKSEKERERDCFDSPCGSLTVLLLDNTCYPIYVYRNILTPDS